MADYPAWNYWAWEQLLDGRQRPVETSDGVLYESDIRNDMYWLDVNRWCKRGHFFWTPQEAALISFGRDPDKVDRTEDDFIFHDDFLRTDDEDGQKNVELRQFITDVYEAIRHAQVTGELRPRIAREAYIEWAKDEGIDVPHFVVEAIDAFERDREREADIAERSGLPSEIPGAASRAFATATDVHTPIEGASASLNSSKEHELDIRKETSLKLLIYALLIKGDWLKKKLPPKQLVGFLEQEFKDRGGYKGGLKIPSVQTIRNHLKEVNELVGKFLISR